MSSITQYQHFQTMGLQNVSLAWHAASKYNYPSQQNCSSVTYLGNRLLQNPDGSIETILKPPGEVFAERILNPFLKTVIKVTIKVTKGIDHFASGFFFIPVANAEKIPDKPDKYDNRCTPDDRVNPCEQALNQHMHNDVFMPIQNLTGEIINLKKKVDNLTHKIDALDSKTNQLTWTSIGIGAGVTLVVQAIGVGLYKHCRR